MAPINVDNPNQYTILVKAPTLYGSVTNLSGQDMCLCGKHISLIDPIKEQTLRCFHCKKRYHPQCMKRHYTMQVCTFCHLKYMSPVMPVKKMLFVGLLLRGRKTHEIDL